MDKQDRDESEEKGRRKEEEKKRRKKRKKEIFFFNDTATTEIYTLSLHDALPISRQLKLNMPQFQKDMNSNEAKQLVSRDFQEGKAVKVTGTPTIFINGRRLRERNLAAIQKIIDEELAE